MPGYLRQAWGTVAEERVDDEFRDRSGPHAEVPRALREKKGHKLDAYAMIAMTSSVQICLLYCMAGHALRPHAQNRRPSQATAQGYLLHWLADQALRLRAWNGRADSGARLSRQ